MCPSHRSNNLTAAFAVSFKGHVPTKGVEGVVAVMDMGSVSGFKCLDPLGCLSIVCFMP